MRQHFIRAALVAALAGAAFLPHDVPGQGTQRAVRSIGRTVRLASAVLASPVQPASNTQDTQDTQDAQGTYTQVRELSRMLGGLETAFSPVVLDRTPGELLSGPPR